jgi:chemotaxis response regulator CheB
MKHENNFYVYQHVNDGGAVVFYGMGNNDAAWTMKGRTSAHHNWMSKAYPDHMRVMMITTALTEQGAEKVLEATLAGAGSLPPFNKPEVKKTVEVKEEKKDVEPKKEILDDKPVKQKPKSAPKFTPKK